jgi:hypothetical protein
MTLCARLAAHFSARPGQWIDGRELGQIAGAYAWRSRVSDLRHLPYNLTIENRQRKEQTMLGEPFTVSEYRWMPDIAVYACTCALLGDEAPCGWCDGPDREWSAQNAR